MFYCSTVIFILSLQKPFMQKTTTWAPFSSRPYPALGKRAANVTAQNYHIKAVARTGHVASFLAPSSSLSLSMLSPMPLFEFVIGLYSKNFMKRVISSFPELEIQCLAAQNEWVNSIRRTAIQISTPNNNAVILAEQQK